ncbi:response regulator transcription factor [Paenibacillus sacheonensis]|uniref:Response regulator n=1 Tax=Paenibacillus sacheonensis TaxID=742054 RepID=A0A7X4YVS8_9BACL|nr:response regulator [Paenibacillus sacheonensis]MBM7569469.1 two-component system response regulator YesN [Paenibacillus sacheonensis]NBC73363.1 response regulator [Paenibacillus sacheonensis]
MYTLLIVDDEPIIADGLYEEFKACGQWELDVHRVYSGKAALELLGRMKVDLILSDIRMPGLDGIGLLHHVKNSWPSCRVIFLTGYKEFDYAHRAMEYGAVRYILKTEGYGKVMEAVEQTIAEIERSLRAEALIAEARERLRALNEMTLQDLLGFALNGEMEAGPEIAEELLRLGMPIDPHEPIWMAVCRFDALFPPVPSGYMARKAAVETIRLIAEQYFSPLVESVMTASGSHLMVWLLQMKPASDRTDNSVQRNEQIGLFIRETLETIQRAAKETTGRTVSFAVRTETLQWAEMSGVHQSLALLLDSRFGAGTEMLRTDKQEARSQDIVAKVKVFIDAHLHDDISLVRLADLVHFNPTYLSRFFKQQTGLNLSEFIQTVRLERAKQLLADSENRINDIAASLGYGSASNFARSFKKLTGLAPQEFRDACRR